MESEDLLQLIQKLASMSQRLQTTITESDLSTLEDCLKPDHEQRPFYRFGTKEPQHEMAAAVVGRLVEANSCPTPLLARLVRLAVLADKPWHVCVDRALQDRAWDQTLDILDIGEASIAERAVDVFCDDPTPAFARTIIRCSRLSAYVSVERSQFAGKKFSEVTRALADKTSLKRVARAFLFLVTEPPGEWEDALEMFVGAFGQVHQDSVIQAVGDGMSTLWARYSEVHRPYYHSSEHDHIRQTYERCRDIAKTVLGSSPLADLLEALDCLCDTPFHKYKTLSQCSAQLALAFCRVATGKDKLVVSLLRLVDPARIHPAAFRYAVRCLKRKQSERFLPLLSAADSSAAAQVQPSLIAASEDEEEPIFDPDGMFSEAYDPDARIWPMNYAIITRLFEPVEKARGNFARLMRSEWNRDEDSLSERLMALLWEELHRCGEDRDLQRWITDNYRYGFLKVEEPYVRDREPEWGADIGILVQYHVAKTLRHTWGYLLQAKKAAGRRHPTRWDIDRAQAEDLVLRTRSAFYVLYTPEDEPGVPYVVPARTVLSSLHARDYTRRGDKGVAHSITYDAGRGLGKSWSCFFLEDIIGAWSGEPDRELAKAIREGVAARHVFEVTVAVGAEGGWPEIPSNRGS